MRASKSGRSNFSQARRRGRRAAESLGELHFEADSRSHALLDQIIDLKCAQYVASGAPNFFSDEKRRQLLHHLLDRREDDFSGLLSAVHCGNRLVAGHFGLRSEGVAHWWFPVYDPELAHLAPGWILLRELVAAAPGLGIRRLDLGRGDDEYKRRAMTGSEEVGEGFVSASRAARTAFRMRAGARELVRASGVAPRVRGRLRNIRGLGT
nr:GNAT family N-acetyltransferase [Pedococcus badiiscoriae]